MCNFLSFVFFTIFKWYESLSFNTSFIVWVVWYSWVMNHDIQYENSVSVVKFILVLYHMNTFFIVLPIHKQTQVIQIIDNWTEVSAIHEP